MPNRPGNVGELFDLLTTENHRSKNFDPTREGFVGHGKSGMVYWAESTLKKIASKEKVESAISAKGLPHEIRATPSPFSRLVSAEFDAVDDIAANGLRDPIVLHNGMILDGGNRAAACEAAGVDARYVEFAGGNSCVSLCCRPTCIAGTRPGGGDCGQCAGLGEAQIAGGDRKSADQSATWHFDSADSAAQSGASERTQKRADKVAKGRS